MPGYPDDPLSELGKEIIRQHPRREEQAPYRTTQVWQVDPELQRQMNELTPQQRAEAEEKVQAHLSESLDLLQREMLGLPPRDGQQGYYVPAGTRRWKILRISGQALAMPFLEGAHRGYLARQGLPTDATIVRVRGGDDDWLELVVESATFEPVPEGRELPSLEPVRFLEI